MTFTAGALLLISAETPPYPPRKTPFVVPSHFPKPVRDPEKDNVLTKEGFALGKKIFYDPNLSGDGQVSCASCHQPFAAFATLDHDLSHGAHNSFTSRNAPALINLAWMGDLHWDGAINHLEVQPLAPMSSKNEMGGNLDTVIFKLRSDSSYTRMFAEAFGSSNVTSKRILKALAQFTMSLVSATSRYDSVVTGKASFTTIEAEGYKLFKANCATCHPAPLFTDNSFRNNGMPLNKIGDKGRMMITGKKTDSLKFKVPTLRNAALSLPLMHDGSVPYLHEAIDRYTKIDTSIALLDPVLKKKRISLNAKEKEKLLHFIYTLSDYKFVRDPRFQPDFVVPETPSHH